MAVEKPQTVLAGLERAACHPPLAQVEQIGPHLFLAELIGRASVMRGQPAHRLGVDLLCPQSQPGQGHVFNHPRTQWRHGGLPSSMFRRATSCPPARKDTLACLPPSLARPTPSAAANIDPSSLRGTPDLRRNPCGSCSRPAPCRSLWRRTSSSSSPPA